MTIARQFHWRSGRSEKNGPDLDGAVAYAYDYDNPGRLDEVSSGGMDRGSGCRGCPDNVAAGLVVRKSKGFSASGFVLSLMKSVITGKDLVDLIRENDLIPRDMGYFSRYEFARIEERKAFC